jgi:hypothetical protein
MRRDEVWDADTGMLLLSYWPVEHLDALGHGTLRPSVAGLGSTTPDLWSPE